MDITQIDRLFQQILEGWDIPTPQGMLRVNRVDAEATLPGMPYSMAKNLRHAVYWQDLWLGELAGEPRKPQMEVWKDDWKEPEPGAWDALRRSFVEGLQKARWYCGDGFGSHKCASDQDAADKLLAIAIHASYHMGQLNLLKRARRARD
jgi:hypothetical protein